MKTVIENQYNDCVGCNTCAQICPKSCIIMETNDEGFWYPYIDESLCIDCGLCRERCPIHYKEVTLNSPNPDAFGAQNLDKGIKKESSSGGIFSILAESILDKEGVVLGAAFNENMRLEHIMVDSIHNLAYLRGSKYLQSDTGNTFSKVKEKLNSGRLVMFTGTPCQVAGLNSFLGTRHENLLMCDVICHGVPSPKVFEDYLQEIERKNQSNVTGYSFRDKTKGWGKPSVIIEFENGMKESTTLLNLNLY